MADALDLHPTYRNARYTLRALYADRAQAETKVAELQDQEKEVLFYDDTTPSGRTGYFVAARHRVAPGTRTGLPHNKDASWRATAFGIGLFRKIARSSYGKPIRRWYKDLDAQGLRKSLQRLDWSGTNLDVATQLVSNLILAHPFPNANHRSSIDIARFYLASVGLQWPHYSLRGRGRRERFFRDTKEFFFESKYLLQLHRHMGLVRAAHEHGYTHLQIGEDAVVEINPEDLLLGREEIVARHKAAARRLVRSLASEEDAQNLDQPRGKSLREWVQWIEGS